MKTSLLPAATALPVLLAWVLSGAAAAPAAEPAPSGPLAAKAVSEALGAALRADVPTALTALQGAPVEQFNAKDIAFRTCMIERHERTSPPPPVGETDDPLARKVLDLYQNYWWHAVRDPAGRPARDAKLKADLAATMGESPPADGDEAFDALTERINVKLRAAGLHPLQGRTPPLYDLLVWRQQEERDYTVALPGGEQQPVKVYVMDDWLSRGWSHYTACSYTGAAGWANEQGLFAVRSAYGDLKGEDFKVSFLGHESQHYADLKRWPDMPPWTLEYRAKLVELALADDTRIKLLDRFYRSQDDEPDHPHPYANKRVIAAVLQRLGQPVGSDLRQSDPEAVRRAAREVLIEDTRKRKAETPVATAAPKA